MISKYHPGPDSDSCIADCGNPDPNYFNGIDFSNLENKAKEHFAYMNRKIAEISEILNSRQFFLFFQVSKEAGVEIKLNLSKSKDFDVLTLDKMNEESPQFPFEELNARKSIQLIEFENQVKTAIRTYDSTKNLKQNTDSVIENIMKSINATAERLKLILDS